MNSNIKTLLATTTRTHLTVMSIVSKYPINSPKTRTLITEATPYKAC